MSLDTITPSFLFEVHPSKLTSIFPSSPLTSGPHTDYKSLHNYIGLTQIMQGKLPFFWSLTPLCNSHVVSFRAATSLEVYYSTHLSKESNSGLSLKCLLPVTRSCLDSPVAASKQFIHFLLSQPHITGTDPFDKFFL